LLGRLALGIERKEHAMTEDVGGSAVAESADDAMLLELLSIEIKLNDPRTSSLVRVEQTFDLSNQHLIRPAPVAALALDEIDQGDERGAVLGDAIVQLDRNCRDRRVHVVHPHHRP